MAEYKHPPPNVVFVPPGAETVLSATGGRSSPIRFRLVDRWIEIFDKAAGPRLIEGGHLSDGSR